MRTFRRIAFGICLGFIVQSCAQSHADLRGLVASGKYAEAAAAAEKDDEAAVETAAAVLEAAALGERYRFLAIESLSVAGREGRASLERLALRSDEVGRIAAVALRRFDKHEADRAAVCAVDEHADVRKMCLLAFARELKEPLLRSLLLDTDPSVRWYALRALTELPADKERAPLFIDVLLRDPSLTVRMEAARHGDLLGDDGFLLLKELLFDTRPGMRTAAVTGLSVIGSASAASLLRNLSEGARDEVTLTAAAACAASGDATCRERLVSALDDDRPGIRTAALYLLGPGRIENARQRFLTSLKDKSPEVVLAAANLLKGDRAARPQALRALGDIAKRRVHESSAALRLMAVLGDKGAETRIQITLKSAAKMEESALIALLNAVQGASGLIDAVVPLLGDSREAVRVNAARFILFSRSKI